MDQITGNQYMGSIFDTSKIEVKDGEKSPLGRATKEILISVGRSDESGIQVMDPTVSRNHALIKLSACQYNGPGRDFEISKLAIVDNGSKNGTSLQKNNTQSETVNANIETSVTPFDDTISLGNHTQIKAIGTGKIQVTSMGRSNIIDLPEGLTFDSGSLPTTPSIQILGNDTQYNIEVPKLN